MKLVSRILRAVILLSMLVGYGLTVYMGSTEERRRSMHIAEPRPTDDYVGVEIRITSIDTVQGLLTERIRLVPSGRLAIDKNTPAVDLKLLVNAVSGQQSISFPKNQRIAPFDTTVMLSGNPNKYPFDTYYSDTDLLVTTPATRIVTSVPGDVSNDTQAAVANGSLVVGTNDLNHSETVPIPEEIFASIPQFKFRGAVTRDGTHKLAHTHLIIRRSNNVVATSIVVMATMILLAISVLGMVVRVTSSPGEINLLPLSLCITLIFGLPALRNIQPGVPGVGVLGDYVSFIWATLIVSTSAIALAWTWILRSRQLDIAATKRKTDGNG